MASKIDTVDRSTDTLPNSRNRLVFQHHSATVPSRPQTNKFQKQFSTNCKNVPVCGFQLLFNLHRLLGISYFGASVPSKCLPVVVKLVLLVWNVFVFAFSYYNYHISTVSQSDDHQSASAASSSPASEKSDENFLGQKSLTQLVNYIRLSSVTVYFLFSYLLNLYLACIARPLLTLIYTQLSPLLTEEAEHRIGSGVALVQTVIVTALSIIFQALLYAQFGQILYVRWVENMFNLFSLSAPIALIAYINYSVGHVIRQTARQDNLPAYIECLLRMNTILEQVTSLFSVAFVVLIMNSVIVCIASLCLLVSDFHSTFYISVIGFIDYSVLLIALCLVAGHPAEITKELNTLFEQQLYRASIQNQYHYRQSTSPSIIEYTRTVVKYPYPTLTLHDSLINSQLMTLNNLQKSIQIAPFGVFHLSRSFILKFYSFILSYSVILIQTSEQNVSSIPNGPLIQTSSNITKIKT